MSQQLIAYANSLKDFVQWDALKDLFDRHLAKHTDTRGKRWSIGAAVALILLGRIVYEKGRPSKRIRQEVPFANRWLTAKKAIFDLATVDDLYQDVYKDLEMKGNGVYVRYERSGWVFHVTNSLAVKQIMLKTDIFPKRDMHDMGATLFFKFLGVENILFSSNTEWKRHRKIVNPAFHRSMPVRLFSELTADMISFINEQHPSKTFTLDAGALFERITLDIISKAAYGVDFNALKDDTSAWKVKYDAVINAVRQPGFFLFPFLDQKLRFLFPARVKSFKETEQFRGMLGDLMKKKRDELKNNIDHTTPENEKDLLTLMIEAEMRGEGDLTTEEILNDLAVFFVAGHDTTAVSLMTAVYCLARHPEIQEKARNEVNEVLCGGADPKEEVLPSLEDTKKFVYLNQVIKESLRFGGPITSFPTPRVVQSDVQLAGTDVILRKGDLVNINLYEMHHSDRIYDQPYVFKPERFDEDKMEQTSKNGLSWIPFSNGARQCLGMNFSLAEQRVMLAMLLRQYDLSLPADSIHKDKYIIGPQAVLKPVNLQIQFTRRF
ncbi:cytochrome P-450 cyp509A1 [Gongronella butleri]|nr:cytochrome P-450 cyp509A1 [Gongronella butleri]